MWYLQADILVRMLVACALTATGSAIARKYLKQRAAARGILLLDVLLLLYVDKYLALFYIGYTLFTYALLAVLYRLKRGRRGLFVVFCLLCAAPFFYVRFAGLFGGLPVYIVLVGFAYNMLKAIDAVFYVYYAETKIPFISYACFLLFFPVFSAGPIFRYRDFAKNLDEPLTITSALTAKCVKRFILGLFKKLVLVELAGLVLDRLLAMEPVCYASLLTVVLSYLYLYLDLSGYSDLAIAAGGMCGFAVPENFKNPFTAATFTQFWRKWHVTLSDWIREHIFVVVRGKRLDKYKSALIGFITMLVMSLWHDFAPLNLVSGVYMGLFLVYENLFSKTTVDRRRTKKPAFFLHCLAVNLLFAVNALLFIVEPAQALEIARGLFRF